MVFRLRSSSTLILLATLSSPGLSAPQPGIPHSGAFILAAAIASGIALWLALLLRRRLLWGICLFSLNYPLVAALHGYPGGFGDAVLPVQDAMISYLSLLSYATALWLHSEVLILKQYAALAPAVARCYWRQYCASRQRSPRLYGQAMRIEAAMFFIAAPILLITSWLLWRRKAIDLNTLLLGLLPPVYVASAALVLLSIHGVIPFHNTIYSAGSTR